MVHFLLPDNSSSCSNKYVLKMSPKFVRVICIT